MFGYTKGQGPSCTQQFAMTEIRAFFTEIFSCDIVELNSTFCLLITKYSNLISVRETRSWGFVSLCITIYRWKISAKNYNDVYEGSCILSPSTNL